MDHSEKTLLAAKLAEDLRAYGVGLLRDARAVEDEGAEPSVRVDMKDGLTFRLPFDFDVAPTANETNGNLLSLYGQKTKTH